MCLEKRVTDRTSGSGDSSGRRNRRDRGQGRLLYRGARVIGGKGKANKEPLKGPDQETCL